MNNNFRHNRRRNNRGNRENFTDTLENRFKPSNPNYRNRRSNHYNNRRNRRSNRSYDRSNQSNQIHITYLPLYVYICLAVLGLIWAYTYKPVSNVMEAEWTNHRPRILFGILIKILWGILIFVLCNHGYIKTAWVIVLFPFIMAVLLILLALAFFAHY